jgi:hypothetical protein
LTPTRVAGCLPSLTVAGRPIAGGEAALPCPAGVGTARSFHAHRRFLQQFAPPRLSTLGYCARAQTVTPIVAPTWPLALVDAEPTFPRRSRPLLSPSGNDRRLIRRSPRFRDA